MKHPGKAPSESAIEQNVYKVFPNDLNSKYTVFGGLVMGLCDRTALIVVNYRSKVSGPLLDRIDLHVEVQRPSRAALRPEAPPGERSHDVAVRVCKARRLQLRRSGQCNARLEGNVRDNACFLAPEPLHLLENATEKFGLSARAYHRIQRVARTIADLAGEKDIAVPHVAEALSLRQLDRKR